MTEGGGAVSSEDALDAFYEALLDDDAVALYERAPCGYLSTAPDGTIVKANQTLLTLLGYQQAELVGLRRFTDLLSPGGQIYYETHYAPMLQMQGKAREIALDLVCADGRRLPVLVNSVLERRGDGTPTVIRTVVFDATDRRNYERELLRAKEKAEESEAHAQLLARTLQQTLIPPGVPEIAGLDVGAIYRPAGTGAEVGGDFYDVFEVAADEWVVVVGDVSGKGVDAAVVTAAARYTVRAAAVRNHGPSAVLRVVNDVLLGHPSERFCTVVLVRLRHTAPTWSATISLGGHPRPMLVRGGEPTPIGEPGSLVGLFDEPTFHDTQVTLEEGDALVLYTDGVTEGRRGTEFFGEGGLSVAVRTHGASASSLAEGVLDEVVRFQSGQPRDDIVIVALCVNRP